MLRRFFPSSLFFRGAFLFFVFFCTAWRPHCECSPCCLFFTEVDVRQGDAPLDLFPSFQSCLCQFFTPALRIENVARGGHCQLPRATKKNTASARQREDRSGHESPSRWSRRRSAQPRLMHVHPCCLCQSESFHALPLASSVRRSLVL